ncbi:hypothetical protein [Lichenibacterium ramalinae]|uniref:Uncharacterized protein n=1 Tax=Lichenibacterium ramalinae TaxID=2316527 RepID=A0A4Q2RE80_9HYPH|nr:hypothetical protein [Lichenibacterium ramalinae]RYB05762.1 hypothetical protein D3272_09280 [Lichenibacterium ramalinae]
MGEDGLRARGRRPPDDDVRVLRRRGGTPATLNRKLSALAKTSTVSERRASHDRLVRLDGANRETGIDATAIPCVMGHRSITTAQRYIHMSPTALEAAMAAMTLDCVQCARLVAEPAPEPCHMPQSGHERFWNS